MLFRSEDDIFDAADGCPVDVIIVVEGGESEAVVEEEAPAAVVEVVVRSQLSKRLLR